MRYSSSILFGVLILIGFLTGSTAYFYTKSRVASETKNTNISFDGEVKKSGTTDTTPDNVDSLTKPADPKGRLSYPANTYQLQAGEGLFTIGSKMGMAWSIIKLANGITNENIVQLGTTLVIPKYNKNTDYYRINFIINEDVATELNLSTRDQSDSEYFDPVKVAKKSALVYWGILETDNFSLLQADKSKGEAIVIAKRDKITNVIGLTQPKITGDKGIWAIVYIEHREESGD